MVLKLIFKYKVFYKILLLEGPKLAQAALTEKFFKKYNVRRKKIRKSNQTHMGMCATQANQNCPESKISSFKTSY